MLQFPSIPSWDAMHPLLVHFPIVLLLMSPVFVLIAAVLRPAKHRPYMTVALIMLLLGTASLYLAAYSGEDAAELADRNGGANAVLATHESLASTSKIVFMGFSMAYVVLFAWPWISQQPQGRISTTAAPLVFLALYSVGVVYLINTAHAGGRLVHEFGVHAMMPQDRGTTSENSTPASSEHGEGD